MDFIGFLVGTIFGTVITSLIFKYNSKSGVLRIDHSNPEKDLYKLELGDLDELSKKKHLVLTIDHNADLSQE